MSDQTPSAPETQQLAEKLGVTPAPAPEARPPAAAQPPAQAPETPPQGEDREWLSRRIEQAKRAGQRQVVRELLGVEDLDEARAQLARLKQAEEEHEKRRREEMSEIERAREDREEALRALQEAQQRLEEQHQQSVVTEMENMLTGLASQYIRPDMVEDALDRLQVHVQGMDDADLEEFDPEEWLATLAYEKPVYAAAAEEEEAPEEEAAEEEAPAEEEPPVHNVRVSPPDVGNPPARKPATEQRPARSYKDMSNADLNQELKRLGLSFRFTERPGQK
jgi:anion-transporting  ArsA/GET3 family ATPase